MALTNQLRELRKARGEGLREVARAVEMDPTHLSKVERNLVRCGDDVKVALARHFGVPVGNLFFGEVVENPATEPAGVAS